MSILNYNRQITVSTAGNRKATNWVPTVFWASDFVDRFPVPFRSAETQAEYLNYPKGKQDDLKDVGGFVGGELRNQRRKACNVVTRELIALDADNVPAGGTQDIVRRADGLGCWYIIYSTRKHHEAAPRLRVLILLDRPCTADEYEPGARMIAKLIDPTMAIFDPSTFEASRLMYWPSCCSDAPYVFHFGDKPFASIDGLLALYTDWHNVAEWPQVPGTDQAYVRLAAKQGDPTEKPGVVGAFCKVYDIYAAMDTWLPGIYEPTDIPGRYSYTGGSTTGGAVIYDDGRFLYSHHATDPCGGRLVNAFDMVRLHRFGDQDDDATPGTPTNRLPSYTAMCQAAVEDTSVSTLLNTERYVKATEAFGDMPEADVKSVEDLMAMLQKSFTTGLPAKTTDNVLLILEHDPLLKGKLAFDEFANRGLALGELPWDKRKCRRQWSDTDDAGLRHYIEKVYWISGKERLMDATQLCAFKHRINDVQEYLTALRWDGVKRLDTLLTDYLGAADNIYTRAVIRKSLAAAVARVMEPGIKYDYMPILAGVQGLGKSTLLRLLGRRWYSDSLETFEGKEAAEMVQGYWILEVGELNGLSRSETNAVKQFLSRNEDVYREPYGRRTNLFPRRCVFFGTSNDAEFLRDRTGNRRFWPVDVGLLQPTKNVFKQLAGEVDQIWAEAYVAWQMGEPLYLTGEAEKISQTEQETHRESNAKEGMIREFVARQIPADWDKWDATQRRMFWGTGFKYDGRLIDRDKVCPAEIWCECLGGDIKYMKRTDSVEIIGVLSGIEGWRKLRGTQRFGHYGPVSGGFEKCN